MRRGQFILGRRRSPPRYPLLHYANINSHLFQIFWAAAAAMGAGPGGRGAALLLACLSVAAGLGNNVIRYDGDVNIGE